LLSNLTELNYIKENKNKNIFSAERTYNKNQETSKRYFKHININTKQPNIKCNYCGKREHSFITALKEKEINQEETQILKEKTIIINQM